MKMAQGRPFGGCRIRVNDVNDNETKADEAQAALSDPQGGFSKAKKLVRRTRSLLTGEIPGGADGAEPIEPVSRVDRPGDPE
jgi:hypothetical protein